MRGGFLALVFGSGGLISARNSAASRTFSVSFLPLVSLTMSRSKEVPKLVRAYSRDYKLFYAHLGYCINQWSKIDGLMCECLQFALGTSHHRAAILYYNITAFSFKLQLIDKLMHHALRRDKKTSQLSEWKEIQKTTSKLANFRNFITHQPVDGQASFYVDLDPESGLVSQDIRQAWWEIRPTKAEVKIGKREETEVYKLTDLLNHRYETEALEKKISIFLAEEKFGGRAIVGPPVQNPRAKSAPQKSGRRTSRTKKKSPR